MAHYTLKNVDSKLWREVKILVAKKGITIKQLIINLLIKEIAHYDNTAHTKIKT